MNDDWHRWLPQDQTDWLLLAIAMISGVLLIAATSG